MRVDQILEWLWYDMIICELSSWEVAHTGQQRLFHAKPRASAVHKQDTSAWHNFLSKIACNFQFFKYHLAREKRVLKLKKLGTFSDCCGAFSHLEHVLTSCTCFLNAISCTLKSQTCKKCTQNISCKLVSFCMLLIPWFMHSFMLLYDIVML